MKPNSKFSNIDFIPDLLGQFMYISTYVYKNTYININNRKKSPLSITNVLRIINLSCLKRRFVDCIFLFHCLGMLRCLDTHLELLSSMSTMYLQSRTKYLEQSKEIK